MIQGATKQKTTKVRINRAWVQANVQEHVFRSMCHDWKGIDQTPCDFTSESVICDLQAKEESGFCPIHSQPSYFAEHERGEL